MKGRTLAVTIIVWLFAAAASFSSGVPPISEDSDQDGLCDKCETEMFATNPAMADTDSDGILDGQEDHDGDGLANVEEL